MLGFTLNPVICSSSICRCLSIHLVLSLLSHVALSLLLLNVRWLSRVSVCVCDTIEAVETIERYETLSCDAQSNIENVMRRRRRVNENKIPESSNQARAHTHTSAGYRNNNINTNRMVRHGMIDETSDEMLCATYSPMASL